MVSSPAVIRSAISVHVSQQRDDVVTVVGGDVERDEMQAVLRRGDDPGLMCPSKRDDTVGRVGSGAVALPITAPARDHRPGPHRAEQSAAGIPGVLGHCPDALRNNTLNLADFSGQCVEQAGQFLTLRCGHRVVGDEPFAFPILLQGCIEVGEPTVDHRSEFWILLVEDRTQSGDRSLRTVDIGLEIIEIGVRENVLLAGDLRGGDLVEEALCVARDAGGIDHVVLCIHQVRELLDVDHELIGNGVRVGLGPVDPQVLLDAVEARPFLTGFEVGLAQVEARIEVAEAFGLGLDAFVICAGQGEHPPWLRRHCRP